MVKITKYFLLTKEIHCIGVQQITRSPISALYANCNNNNNLKNTICMALRKAENAKRERKKRLCKVKI